MTCSVKKSYTKNTANTAESSKKPLSVIPRGALYNIR